MKYGHIKSKLLKKIIEACVECSIEQPDSGTDDMYLDQDDVWTIEKYFPETRGIADLLYLGIRPILYLKIKE